MNKAEHRQWRVCVLGAGLTEMQRLVLLALETFADYPAGTNARPGVELLAEMCRCDRHTAGEALRAGVKAGLIEQTARQVPKMKRAAVYRLLPQPVSRASSAAVENPVSMAGSDVSMAGSAVSMAAATATTNPLTPIPLHQEEIPLSSSLRSADIPQRGTTANNDEEVTEVDKPIRLCPTLGCGQPSDVWNSIEGKEYCDDCFARLKPRNWL